MEKIYLVYAYGGEYEDKWDMTIKAFSTREKADAFVEELKNKPTLSNEQYAEVQNRMSMKECDIFEKYMTADGTKIDPAKRDAYEKEIDDLYNNFEYDYVKEHYGLDKEEYAQISFNIDNDFSGYRVKEVPFGD